MALAPTELASICELKASIKLIDDALVTYIAKNLVATAEVTNILLDIRQIIVANIPLD
jgi:hypothetical protein